MEERLEAGTPVVWVLTLLAAVIPGVLLLLGVRWAADRIEPGYGTAAAITLGVGSMVMIFASEYFSHVISAALGFAAFLVLMREREGPPSTAVVAGAGALAGLAISFEYQVGLVGVVLFFYALARSEPRLPRGAAFALGGTRGGDPGARLQRLGAGVAVRVRLQRRGRRARASAATKPSASTATASSGSRRRALGRASSCCSRTAGCWC